MEKSFFENKSDKVLFVFLKSLKKEFKDKRHIISVLDIEFSEAVKNLSNVFGFGYSDVKTIDVDYIGEAYKLNYKLLEEPNLESPLKRPKLEIFSVEFDEFRTDYVRYTYRVPISTYSGIKNVSEVALTMQSEDDIFIYDNLIDSDTIDSDFSDIKVDSLSIKKIS